MHQEEYYAPIYVDKLLNAAFRHCVYPSCTHANGIAVTFHADCARMAARFENPLTRYRPITEYSYQPSKEHQKRRRETIRVLIENALHRTYGNLSPELWRIVSDDDELIRLYTIAEISLTSRRSERSFNLATTVWATYITIDGIEYVGSLSKSPMPGARQAWCGVASSENRALYVSNDHLGIRQIVFDTALAEVNVPSPVYWQTLSIQSQELSFIGDVSANG
jgi:hypothetical protein